MEQAMRCPKLSSWSRGPAQWPGPGHCGVSGTVRDESGTPLPGVTVTVRHARTGATRSSVSNESEACSLPNLPLGIGRLDAPQRGLNRFTQAGHRPAGQQQSGYESGPRPGWPFAMKYRF
jgi:hypothetical protein